MLGEWRRYKTRLCEAKADSKGGYGKTATRQAAHPYKSRSVLEGSADECRTDNPNVD